MAVKMTVPEEVVKRLGEDFERKLLEPVLIDLVQSGDLTVARAGSLLGLNRREAIQWSSSHNLNYFNQSEEDLEHERANLRKHPPRKVSDYFR